MRTRFVWLLPPLGVGEPRQGYVLSWRQQSQASGPPIWSAYVVAVDDRHGNARAEWVPAMYLVPAFADPPGPNG